jgi:hypothetical protein
MQVQGLFTCVQLFLSFLLLHLSLLDTVCLLLVSVLHTVVSLEIYCSLLYIVIYLVVTLWYDQHDVTCSQKVFWQL